LGSACVKAARKHVAEIDRSKSGCCSIQIDPEHLSRPELVDRLVEKNINLVFAISRVSFDKKKTMIVEKGYHNQCYSKNIDHNEGIPCTNISQ
jgi:hypothetical protein